MKQRKPRAYLAKYRTGYFGLEYTYCWIAHDYWHHEVARGKTKKECEAECRRKGYVPENL